MAMGRGAGSPSADGGGSGALAGQRGQATPEYVALLVLVALVLGAAGAVVADPGLGRTVLDGMRRALCVVSGLGCSAAREPCVVESRRDRDQASVTVAVVRLGADATVLRERRSDGTVAVTLLGGGSAGADLGLGGRVELPGRSLSAGGDLRVVAVAGLGGGRTWIVPGEAAAERLVKALGQTRRPLVDGPLGLVRDVLGKGPDLPEPDATITEGGTGRDAGGSLGAGRSGGDLGVGLGEAVGLRSDRRTGRRTFYLRVNRIAEGGLSSRLLGRGTASAEGALALGVTVDRKGAAIELSVTAAGTLTASAAAPALLRRLAGDGRLTEGGRLEVDGRLDLRDPDNAAAAARLLAALRRPDRAGELLAAAAALGDRLRDYSDLEARSYRVDRSVSGAGGRIKLGGGLGGDIERERVRAVLAGAWERPPGGFWQPSLECVGDRAGA